jgi:peptidoglycan endopeptidase LytE
MNNPLIPQGSLLEQKNKSRARVKIAVFLVLTIHGIGLLALLMQGCKKEPDLSTQTEPTNNPAAAFVEPTNTPTLATNDIAANTNTTPPPAAQTPAPVTSATDYVIAKGDSFSTIAKKFHVSVKALMDANPGVEPTKLKIGQKINIPPAGPSSSSTTPSGAAGSTAGTSGAEQMYTVKSGDSLTKISTQFGISIKALRAVNNLKTDKIVVGQKLKIPAKASGTTASTDSTSPAAGTSNPTSTPTGQ